MTQKSEKLLRLTPTILVAITLGIGSSLKIAGAPVMQENFSRIHMLMYMPWVGMLELSSLVLFIIPVTSRIGLMMLTAHLGGAIAVELASGGIFFVPAIILSLVWLGFRLRNPALFTRSVNQKNSFVQLG